MLSYKLPYTIWCYSTIISINLLKFHSLQYHLLPLHFVGLHTLIPHFHINVRLTSSLACTTDMFTHAPTLTAFAIPTPTNLLLDHKLNWYTPYANSLIALFHL